MSTNKEAAPVPSSPNRVSTAALVPGSGSPFGSPGGSSSPVVKPSCTVKEAIDILLFGDVSDMQFKKLVFELQGVITSNGDFAEEFLDRAGLQLIVDLVKKASGSSVQSHLLLVLKSLLNYVNAIEAVKEQPELVDKIYHLLAPPGDGGPPNLNVVKATLEVLIVICHVMPHGRELVHDAAKRRAGPDTKPYAVLAPYLASPDLLVVRNTLLFMNVMLRKAKEEAGLGDGSNNKGTAPSSAGATTMGDHEAKNLVFRWKESGLLNMLKPLTSVDDPAVKQQLALFQKQSAFVVPRSWEAAEKYRVMYEDMRRRYETANESLFIFQQQQAKVKLLKMEFQRAQETLKLLGSAVPSLSRHPHPTKRFEHGGGLSIKELSNGEGGSGNGAPTSSLVNVDVPHDAVKEMTNMRKQLLEKFLTSVDIRTFAEQTLNIQVANVRGATRRTGGSYLSGAAAMYHDDPPPPTDSEDLLPSDDEFGDLPPSDDDEDFDLPPEDDEDFPDGGGGRMRKSKSGGRFGGKGGAGGKRGGGLPDDDFPDDDEFPDDDAFPDDDGAAAGGGKSGGAVVDNKTAAAAGGGGTSASSGGDASASAGDSAGATGTAAVGGAAGTHTDPTSAGATAASAAAAAAAAAIAKQQQGGTTATAPTTGPAATAAKTPAKTPAKLPVKLGKGMPVIGGKGMPVIGGKGAAGAPKDERIYFKGKAPEKKMRPLHWDKIALGSLEGTIWAKVHDGLPSGEKIDADFDYAEFESMFSQKEAKKDDGPKKKKEEELMLVDPKTFMNLSIMLHKLPPIPNIQQAVNELDTATLKLDQIQALLNASEEKAMPPDMIKEFRAKQHTKDPSEYNPPEKFVSMVLSMGDVFKPRLAAWTFTLSWKDSMTTLRAPLLRASVVMDAVLNSEHLPYVMAVLLGFGNLMNHGAAKGNAPAVMLNVLGKLDASKDNRGKTSLMQHLLNTVRERNPGALELATELKCLWSENGGANQLKLDDLDKSVSEASGQLNQFNAHCATVKRLMANDPMAGSDPFGPTMSQYGVQAQQDLDEAKELLETAKGKYKQMIKYFGYPEKRAPKLEEMAAELAAFVAKVRKVHDDAAKDKRKAASKGKKLNDKGLDNMVGQLQEQLVA